ncbi:MAG: alpha/beta fold hydrolase [Verrucomicrobiota bacterium]
MHGLGDHGERHRRHLEVFSRNGVLCHAIDLPGHGRNEGQRGHFSGIHELMETIRKQVIDLREKLPAGTPMGLMGHSMGGFLTLHFLGRYPELINFSWVSSPLIDARRNVPFFARQAAHALSAFLPRLSFKSAVRTELCKRDPKMIDETKRDDWVHRRITARAASVLIRNAPKLRTSSRNIRKDLKLLMTHGGEDKICPSLLSWKLFESLSVEEKEYVLFRDSLHEPFNDIGREDVYRTLEQWLHESLDLDDIVGSTKGERRPRPVYRERRLKKNVTVAA